MHPGWAAHGGIAAAGLGISGFRGPPTTLEGGHGFYHAHLGKVPVGDASPASGIGKDWLIAGIGLKPCPCCHLTHGFVDCALELRGRVPLEDIESIDCPLHTRLMHVVSGPRRPTEPYAAMFSVPCIVALALVTGKVDLAAFHDRSVGDPAVLAISDRTSCSEDPASDFPAHFPGEVRITLKGGEVVSHPVATSFGTPERPLSEADIEAKFMTNATRVISADAAMRIVRAAWDVERVGHVSELVRLCVGHWWRIPQLCGDGGEARRAGGCDGPAPEPGCDAVEVDGRGGCRMLQAGFGQAAAARPAQAESSHGLRQGAFDPLALCVEAPALCCALSCACSRKGVAVLPRQDRDALALLWRLGSGAAAA